MAVDLPVLHHHGVRPIREDLPRLIVVPFVKTRRRRIVIVVLRHRLHDKIGGELAAAGAAFPHKRKSALAVESPAQPPGT